MFIRRTTSESAVGGGTGSINGVMDAYVTPAGITRLMFGENLKQDNIGSGDGGGDPFAGASSGYESFDKFGVTVKDDDGGDIKFARTRRGFGWKLTGIIVPQ